MNLEKRDDWWHGSPSEDLATYLLRHVLEVQCDGVEHRVVPARCANCGSGTFDLFIANGSRIVRGCTSCKTQAPVCDLDGRCRPQLAHEIVCTCMFSECEVALGLALMDAEPGKGEGPVGYLYVAGRCAECGAIGVYGEWSPDGDFSFTDMASSV